MIFPPTSPPTVLPSEPQNLLLPWEPWTQARLVIPLRRGDERVGVLALGPRNSDAATQQFNDTEQALLTHLSTYLALTIDHARSRDDHQAAMVKLTEQSQMLRLQQEQLAQQTTSAARRAAATDGIRVYALGPLRVEHDGEVITRWGGDKAGTYQAEALFAFLFDRRGRGITKDEAAEVIWPDLEISRADSAFHRTLAALRRTLEPGLKRGNQSRMILYHHDRYWLEPACIAWCDTEEFVAAAERGSPCFISRNHTKRPCC
ncbi:MAG: GAF domain-containing protein [Chloroflexaceae bacterium]|nr:GAF domain-containing protein [Chloroflexaceae bacterium]